MKFSPDLLPRGHPEGLGAVTCCVPMEWLVGLTEALRAQMTPGQAGKVFCNC